jgi:hypothetical protein
MGMLRSQVKQRHEAASPRTIIDIVHLSAKNAEKQEEDPGAQNNAMESLSIHYEPTFSV